MKFLKAITLSALLSFSITAQASVIKVFDVLLDKSQFEVLLNSRGIMNRGVIGQVRKNVRYSLQDIAKSGTASMSDVKAMRKYIKSPQDVKRYNKMMKSFSKDSSKVTRSELVDSINSLVFLSQRYGLKKKAILACAPCVNKELSEAGFSFTLNELKGASSKKIFAEMSRKAKNPTTSAKFINTQIRKQKVGKVANVKAHEEEALIYMLLIPRHGTADQKRVYNSMLKVSKTKNGATDLFDPDNGHKFFNIFSDNLSSSELNLWEELLDDTAKVMDDENLGTIDAFYSVLQKRADGVTDEAEKADLLAKLDFIKKEGCFSK
ncbi:MAG: hypothetical protein BM556_07910 [Bacteriovorax sp. MedPE-SWde]|nr:MAG: hypothetical protein BM556_07910 [Bacteriovorax sp. MedPE-SWde]